MGRRCASYAFTAIVRRSPASTGSPGGTTRPEELVTITSDALTYGTAVMKRCTGRLRTSFMPLMKTESLDVEVMVMLETIGAVGPVSFSPVPLTITVIGATGSPENTKPEEGLKESQPASKLLGDAVHLIGVAASMSPVFKRTSSWAVALESVLVLTSVTWSVSLDERTAISAFRRQRFVVGSRHWSAVQTVASLMHVPLTPPAAW